MRSVSVLLISTLVLVYLFDLTHAAVSSTEEIAGKYIPISRFGQPAKFGGRNQPRSIADALQSGVMSHPLQATMELDEHNAVWVTRHSNAYNDGPTVINHIVDTGDQQGSTVNHVAFRSENLVRGTDDRLLLSSVAANNFGPGRKYVYEFFSDSPTNYQCIRATRRGYTPASQTATSLISTSALNPIYYPDLPCVLNPLPIDEVKTIAVDLDPYHADIIPADEIIVAYRTSNNGLTIGAYHDVTWSQPSGSTFGNGNVSLFASTEASVATELSALNLPTRYSYDMTPCDFDGDGIFEICMAYIKNSELTVRVFGFVGFSRDRLVEKYKQTFSSIIGDRVAVAAHYLGRRGNYQDDFVVSISAVNNYHIWIVRLDGGNVIANKFNPITLPGSPPNPATQYNIHDLAIGDFDGNGQQEVVMSHFGVECYDCVEVSVFHYNDTANTLVKVHRQTYSSSVRSEDYVVEIAVVRAAKVQTPLAEQLIVLYKGIRIIDMRSYLDHKNVTEVDSTFTLKFFAQFSQPNYAQHTHLTVGKIIEGNVRIGQPVHSVYNQVRQVMAVINSPPKHKDFMDGNFIKIGNSDGNTLARITRSSESSKKIGVSQKRDWAVGAGVQVDVGRVTATMSTTYGQNFEKTEKSVETVYYQDVSEVSGDDLIIQLQLSWDVWEYPVRNSDNVTTTSILVMFPRMHPANPTQPDIVMAWVTARTQAEVRSYHEVDNLFSYSAGAPAAITKASYSQQTRTVNGGVSVGITVLLTDLTTSGLSSTSSLAFDASLSASAGTTVPLIGDFGVTLTVSGSYSSTDISTSEISLLTSTQLDVEYGPGQQYSTLSYNVRPYIYFAREGYLVLDYAVDFTGDAGTITQWQLLYNKPDLTWNLPWRWSRNEYTNDFDINQWRTKDMFLQPRRPTHGQSATVTVRIRNYSLIGASGNVTVQLYLGDFNNPSNKFGDAVVINSLDARGNAVFTVTDNYRADVHCLYGVIDSNNNIDELHETNNIAYAIVGEPIQTPMCGQPISAKFKDAFGGVPTTPQSATPKSISNGFKVHSSIMFALASAMIAMWF